MATETSGDSTAAKPSSTTTTTGFCFRPSALSDITDKIWKKSSGDSNLSSVTDSQPKLNLTALASLSTVGTTTNSLFTSSSATPSSPFVFGKNISRRVAHADGSNGNSAAPEPKQEDSKDETDPSDNNQATADDAKGTRTGISFDTLAATSTVIDTVADSNSSTATTAAASESAIVGGGEDAATALEASAAAYEAAKHQKQLQLLAPEDVKTGEEDEVNVVQASVKLYVFDTAKQSWTDRGLAVIRVNDRCAVNNEGDHMETRIVVRLQGSLRVIVNTKLWPDMLLERVSAKRLRLSGTVEDAIHASTESEHVPTISIYLISASQSIDIDRIERSLRDRLARLKPTDHDTLIGKKRPPTSSDESSSSNDSEQGASPAKKWQGD